MGGLAGTFDSTSPFFPPALAPLTLVTAGDVVVVVRFVVVRVAFRWLGAMPPVSTMTVMMEKEVRAKKTSLAPKTQLCHSMLRLWDRKRIMVRIRTTREETLYTKNEMRSGMLFNLSPKRAVRATMV